LYALNARTLALSEKQLPDLDLVASCNACYINLAKTSVALREDEELRKKVNNIIQMEYKGTVRVRHILEVIANDVRGRIKG